MKIRVECATCHQGAEFEETNAPTTMADFNERAPQAAPKTFEELLDIFEPWLDHIVDNHQELTGART